MPRGRAAALAGVAAPVSAGAPGDFSWPVSGPITSPFGRRLDPVSGEFTRMHTGNRYRRAVRYDDRGGVCRSRYFSRLDRRRIWEYDRGGSRRRRFIALCTLQSGICRGGPRCAAGASTRCRRVNRPFNGAALAFRDSGRRSTRRSHVALAIA